MLLQKIKEELKRCMKQGMKENVLAIRNILEKIKIEEVNNKKEVCEDDIIKIVSKYVKQLKDSISQFKAGGRNDLVEKEYNELKIIEKFLPKQLSYIEIEKIVTDIIKSIGATNMSDMGNVIKNVIDQTKGSADGKTISDITKKLLA
tara:strand:+ start:159 stop:599 length:441 start_codon:yes stop_codon:yes gene_type:complete